MTAKNDPRGNDDPNDPDTDSSAQQPGQVEHHPRRRRVQTPQIEAVETVLMTSDEYDRAVRALGALIAHWLDRQQSTSDAPDPTI